MIANFFYTSELRKLLGELENKNNLNRKVLEKVNKALQAACFQTLFVVCFLIFTISTYLAFYGIRGSIFIPALFTVLLFLSVSYHFQNTKKICNKFVVLITSGNRAKGRVTHFWKIIGPNRPQWFCKYSFLEVNGENITGKCNETPKIMGHYEYSKGDEICIAYDPEKPIVNIPITPELEENYNLKTDQI